MEQKQESRYITITIFQQHEFKVIWRINPLKCVVCGVCVCVCVCVCNPLKGACGCKQCSGCSYSKW